MENSNVDFILELLRFNKTIAKMLAIMSPEDQKKYKSQVTWFLNKAEKFIAENGISFVEFNPNDVYDVGMAVNPLNLSDFDKDAKLVIDQVIEPTIMHNGKVLQTGTVLLKKAE